MRVLHSLTSLAAYLGSWLKGVIFVGYPKLGLVAVLAAEVFLASCAEELRALDEVRAAQPVYFLVDGVANLVVLELEGPHVHCFS